jgi:drug/metabolite transporter (DMT)-like permease
MIAAIGAFFMFSVMIVFAKLLSANHSVIEIAFYRNLIACMPFLFIVFVLGKRDILVIRSQPAAVGIRAVIGAISLTMTFAAFSLMPMAETTVLLFTASLFIPVLGVIFLHERVGPYRWAAVAIGFVGVVIMVGPAGNLNTLGVAVALFAALMHATLQVILRYLGRYERPETVTFYFLVIGALVTALPLPFVAVTPTFQLQQHRLGDAVRLDDLERMAAANRPCGRQHRHCLERPGDLAREPRSADHRGPRSREVLEQGNHESLLALNEQYTSLFRFQTKVYQ